MSDDLGLPWYDRPIPTFSDIGQSVNAMGQSVSSGLGKLKNAAMSRVFKPLYEMQARTYGADIGTTPPPTPTPRAGNVLPRTTPTPAPPSYANQGGPIGAATRGDENGSPDARTITPSIGADPREFMKAGAFQAEAPMRPIGSLSVGDIEGEMNARNYLDALYGGQSDELDREDAARAGRKIRGLQEARAEEDLSLVEPPGQESSIQQIGGNEYIAAPKLPRMTGAEYKGALEKQREGDIGYRKAVAGEEAKARYGRAVEEDRQQSYYLSRLRQIEEQARQDIAQVQATLKGDQAAAAIRKIRDRVNEDLAKALKESYEIGIRYSPRESYQ